MFSILLTLLHHPPFSAFTLWFLTCSGMLPYSTVWSHVALDTSQAKTENAVEVKAYLTTLSMQLSYFSK